MTDTDAIALYRREKAASAERNAGKQDHLRAIVLEMIARQTEADEARKKGGRPKPSKPMNEAPSYAQRDRREYDRARYKANREKKIAQAKASYYRRRKAS